MRRPVIIASKLNWVSPEQQQEEVGTINRQFARWLSDWQSRDVEAYLKHYSTAFQSDNKSYQIWSQHKRRVGKQKKYIDVKLNNISILRYPDQGEMIVVSYEQDYRSNNFNSNSSLGSVRVN